MPHNGNNVIVSADYSQIELRLLASLSGDPALIKAFADNKDIHSITAAGILKMPLENVGERERNIAKGVNFGIVYGITPFGLSDRLKISQSEAKEFIDSYFRSFPKVKDFQNGTLDYARKHGFTKTLTGRIRYIDGINSRNGTTRRNAERVALNAPIQGLAADLIKIAMIKCHNYISEHNLSSKMILQIHDELLFEVPKNELEEILENVPLLMESSLQMNVPLKVEIGYGPDWMDLKYS
jgi:DNA polymerase-1